MPCDPPQIDTPITVNVSDVDVLGTYIAFAGKSGTQLALTPAYAAWHLCYVVRINPTYAIELYDAFTGEFVAQGDGLSLNLVTPL